MNSYISNIASVATLILFVMYFIGRMMTIIKETHFGTEMFSIIDARNKNDQDLEFDFGGCSSIKIYSTMSYVSVKVMEIKEYDMNKGIPIKYGRAIEKKTFRHISLFI